MKHHRPISIAIFLLGALSSLAAQTQPRQFHVMLRTMHSEIPTQTSTKACVIVEDDGKYRYEDLPSFTRATPENSKVYTGQLPEAAKRDLESLLNKRELTALGNVPPAHWATKTTREMELVSMVIHRGGAGNQELSYFVADGRGIIPPQVKAFVTWMKSLQKNLGAPVKGAQPDSCRVS